MSYKKFLAVVTLFLCFVISTQISYASSKSVFVLTAQDYSEVQAYRIDANNVTWQATDNVYVDGQTPGVDYGNPVAVAAWPQKNLLFFTNDDVPVITFASSRTLVKIGQYTEPNIISPDGFGGIIVDTVHEKIYAAKRYSANLYVFSWDESAKTLVADGNNPYEPADTDDGNNGYVVDKFWG